MHSHAYRYPQNIKSCPPKSRLIDKILTSEPQPCLNRLVNLVINDKYKRNIKVDQIHGNISHLGEMEDTKETKDQFMKQGSQP